MHMIANERSSKIGLPLNVKWGQSFIEAVDKRSLLVREAFSNYNFFLPNVTILKHLYYNIIVQMVLCLC